MREDKNTVFRCAACGAPIAGSPGQSVSCSFCGASNQINYVSAHDRSIRIQHELLKTRKERAARAKELLDEYVDVQTRYVLASPTERPELRRQLLFKYESFLRIHQIPTRAHYAAQEGEYFKDALEDLEEQIRECLAQVEDALDAID